MYIVTLVSQILDNKCMLSMICKFLLAKYFFFIIQKCISKIHVKNIYHCMNHILLNQSSWYSWHLRLAQRIHNLQIS